tara:strand:- start:4866 stop:5906 length:1041 start_codon:yes stop_codon:yes gene_type:complete
MHWQRFFMPRPGSFSANLVEAHREKHCYMRDVSVDLSVLPFTLPKGDVRFRQSFKAKAMLVISLLMALLFLTLARVIAGGYGIWFLIILMSTIFLGLTYCFIANALMVRRVTFNKHDVHVREYDGTEWNASYRSYLGVKQDDFTFRGPGVEKCRIVRLVTEIPDRCITLDLRHNIFNEPSPLAEYARILGVPIIETKLQPVENLKAGWWTVAPPMIFAFGIFSVVIGGFFLLASHSNKAEFIIQNHASSAIRTGQIKAGNRSHLIRPVAEGTSRTVRFPVSHEGGYTVSVELNNGQKLSTGETGYMTHGVDIQVVIDVHDDEVSVSDVSTDVTYTNSNREDYGLPQ